MDRCYRVEVVDENPYQAPVADGPASEGFVPGGGRARLVAALMLVSLGTSVLAMGSAALDIGVLLDAKSGRFLSDAEADAVDMRAMIVGGIYLLVFIATAVAFGRFVAQANRNVRSLGAYVEYSPASMVWWYFVPIANLWKPYDAIKQVWTATLAHHPDEFVHMDALRGWWAGWVVSSVIDRISSKMGESESLDTLLASSVIDILSQGIMLYTCLAARRWILALDADQQRAFMASSPP
jgi:hypothetical protein